MDTYYYYMYICRVIKQTTMKAYDFVNKVETIQKGSITIEIVKVQKTGTSRVFFVAKHNDKNICRVLWARLYDARNVAKKYIEMKTT